MFNQPTLNLLATADRGDAEIGNAIFGRSELTFEAAISTEQIAFQNASETLLTQSLELTQR